jgi:hexosaminidase
MIPCANSQTADYNVVPLPAEIQNDGGSSFELCGSTVICYSGDKKMKRNAQFLAEYIKENTGLELKIVKSKKAKDNAIILRIGNAPENPEGYNLSVRKENIEIESSTAAGVFYGIQTLRKSLPVGETGKVTMPAVTITDSPRFSYRGAHLDVSRHFFTVIQSSATLTCSRSTTSTVSTGTLPTTRAGASK